MPFSNQFRRRSQAKADLLETSKFEHASQQKLRNGHAICLISIATFLKKWLSNALILAPILCLPSSTSPSDWSRWPLWHWRNQNWSKLADCGTASPAERQTAQHCLSILCWLTGQVALTAVSARTFGGRLALTQPPIDHPLNKNVYRW